MLLLGIFFFFPYIALLLIKRIMLFLNGIHMTYAKLINCHFMSLAYVICMPFKNNSKGLAANHHPGTTGHNVIIRTVSLSFLCPFYPSASYLSFTDILSKNLLISSPHTTSTRRRHSTSTSSLDRDMEGPMGGYNEGNGFNCRLTCRLSTR